MTGRINRAVEQLEQDHAVYYVGGHTGHVLTYEAGRGQDRRGRAGHRRRKRGDRHRRPAPHGVN